MITLKHHLYFTTLALALLLASCGDGDPPRYRTLDGSPPLVIGHRGASGELPEHTLESYLRAIEQGADCIEPDLVMTRDRHLIARHEPLLDQTTDVAEKFPASRKRTMNLDGIPTTGYFASDFTLAEIKSLRARQPYPSRPQQFNGLYSIPTLEEIIELAQQESQKRKRPICIYPEIKHSTFHAQEAGFGANTFEDKLLTILHAAYGNNRTAPVFIQSFEVSNLQYLRNKTKLKLVQLIDADDVLDDGSIKLAPPYHKPYDFVIKGDPRTFADLLKPDGLEFIRTYADGIGPWKPYLVRTVMDGVDRNKDGKLTIHDRRVDGGTGIIEAAHAKGLFVHTWTFRNDSGSYGFSDPLAEIKYYMELGVDGIFTDFPLTGRKAASEL